MVEKKRCQFMSGLIADLKRRVPLYPSDFIDAVLLPGDPYLFERDRSLLFWKTCEP
ncbi:hypothetical protein ACTXT7_010469 [Hymenolepis weldensis]